MKHNLKICFIVNEAFAWGVFGGFGFLTRLLAQGLYNKGVNVCILTPRHAGQKRLEVVNGIRIYGYQNSPPVGPFLRRYIKGDIQKEQKALINEIDADIYHSQEPAEYTYIVDKVMSNAVSIATFQDPWSVKEVRLIGRLQGASSTGMLVGSLYHRWIRQRLVKRFLNVAKGIFCQAKYIIPLVTKMYELPKPPKFLPNPVQVPTRNLRKSDEPMVCFLARWDYVKRPEMFFELAKLFPEVRFIALGKCHSNPLRDSKLRRQYSKIPNLKMPGFVTESEKSKILAKSWILINTSVHECLPISFLEAAAHKCAILSHRNPDEFALRFGLNVGLDLRSYAKGLAYLLKDEKWIFQGKKAHRFVKEVFEFNKVVNLHLSIYESLAS